MSYENLAYFYDRFIADFPYDKIIGYLKKEISFANLSLLDIACGSGNFTFRVEALGAKAIGLDLSLPMLNIAKRKAAQNSSDAIFIQQDINKLKLEKQFDIVTSICDGVNYIKPCNLKNAITCAAKAAKQYIILEFSTIYKAKNQLADNVFFEDAADVTYFFNNRFSPKLNKVDTELTFFNKEKDGKYTRLDDISTQYFYDYSTIESLLEENSFQCQSLDTFTLEAIGETALRALIIGKKI